MVAEETLDILGDVKALVSDKLQVVSYKWLSRNFSVSSNDAKRLLQEFAEKHGSGLEVIYTLSGWLKSDPPVYHIKLVSGTKLADAKKEFGDNYSVQVYSVQACIPKDSAALWNAEFVQAEELFNQPFTVDNCLRDNRFCGVLNAYVKRKTNGLSVAPPLARTATVAIPSRTNIPIQKVNSTPASMAPKVQQDGPKTGQSPAVVTVDVTSGNSHKEKTTSLSTNKKKVQNEKSSSGTGGSLATLWGRTSAKPKPSSPPNMELGPITIVNADAQICAKEAIDASRSDDDDDDQNINHKRAANGKGTRKRRVVMELSDEEDDYENVVSLSSPDPPKKHSDAGSSKSSKDVVLEKSCLNFEERNEENRKIKHEKATEREKIVPPTNALIIGSKDNPSGISMSKKTENLIAVDVADKVKPTDAALNSPKRRKVLKTRIDERGREVTEVVWEGEEAEGNRNGKSRTTEAESKSDVKRTTTVPAENRPSAAKKSPALGSSAPSNPVSKTGAKKAGKGGAVKDTKQGNILSFFKRV